MNLFKKIYCRTVQFGFRLLMPFMPYREPKVYNDVIELAELLISKDI